MRALSTVVANDERVLVTRWHMPPGTETGAHTHGMPYVVVYLTDGIVTSVGADGEIDVPVAQHSVTSRPAGLSHNVCNRTGRPVEFLEIELKLAAGGG